MLQFEELRLRLEGRREELDDLAQAIGYEGLKRKLAELEEQTTAPGFWNDVERSQKNQVETARVKGKIEGWDRLDALYGDTLTLIELADEERTNRSTRRRSRTPRGLSRTSRPRSSPPC